MASWVGAERKSRSLKELDVGDLYDQLESMGAYLKELTSAFGKSASRQYGRARDVVEAGAGGGQQRLDVFHHAHGLFLNAAFDELTRDRVERNRS